MSKQWRPGQKEAVLEAARKRGMLRDPLQPLPIEQLHAANRASEAATVPLASKSTHDSGKRPRGVRRGGKQPNKTEQRFFDILKARQRRGEIASVRYEGMALKWGRDEKTGQSMKYTPDFVVFEDHNSRPVLIEVKGAHIYERDLVRFKGCRAEWPEFTFEMWQWARGEWTKIL